MNNRKVKIFPNLLSEPGILKTKNGLILFSIAI